MLNRSHQGRSVAAKPTSAQRTALVAVKNSVVRIGEGGRVYPRSVNGNALSAAYRRGWWRWPAHPARPGDIARLTAAGERALDEAAAC